ncbi:hypothetical protein CRU92_07350 [Arcobacter sp. FW59]|nr:hypothetical protein CRU92_07350 [Arcobacter sp. FW59]
MTNKLKTITFEQVSFYSVLLFALTLPLSRAAISFFIFWFLLLVIVKKDYKNSFDILKENKIFIYLGIFFIYIFLSALWSDDTQNMVRHLRLYGYWIIIPCLVILTKQEWLYKILNAFLLGMFISEIISYGIYFELWSIEGSSPTQPSPFMLTIHYSVFLAFTSLVLLYRFLFEDESLKAKFILFLFFLMTTTNLLLSTGRTGQLAFFVTLFIVFIIRYKVSIKSIFLSTIFFIAISFIAYSNLDLFKQRVDAAIVDIKKVVLKKDFGTSWGLRAGFWIITYDALKEKPIFGYGLGDHKLTSNEMINKNEYPNFSKFVKKFLTSSHYHNQYLMIAIEGGILGLFLFLLFIYKIYRLKIDDLEMKHIGIIGITVLLISFIGDPLLFLQFPLTLFLFVVALNIIGSKNEIKNV